MTRKEFLNRVGFGAAIAIVPGCIAGLATSCSSDSTPIIAPSNVDFNVDVNSGPLSSNGGFIVSNGIVVARTTSGSFLAVSAACPHEGIIVDFKSSSSNFVCPSHGAKFSSNGTVTQGPASSNLKSYNTQLSGNTLRVYS